MHASSVLNRCSNSIAVVGNPLARSIVRPQEVVHRPEDDGTQGGGHHRLHQPERSGKPVKFEVGMDLACGPSGRAGKRGEPRRELLLTDLATRANTVDSAKLAQTVQHSLACGRGHDPCVKHALFYVLLGAHMPAVLVETEFISNPDREKKLATPPQQ